jgi:hypothetical protein
MLAALALPLRAAEVRLLHADATTVRTETLAPGRDGAGQGLVLQFEANGRRHVLRLRPNLELGATGNRLAGRAQAYAGQAGEHSGSWAAVTLIGSRWSGIWYDGGEYYGVDSADALAPVSDAAAALDPASLMVYRLRDVVWEDVDLEGDTLTAPQDGAQLVAGLTTATTPFFRGMTPTRRLSVALVADALLAAQDGEQVELNLLAQLNVIDGLFANQLGVHIAASSVTVYTLHPDEPFGRTTDASDLLEELATWRADDLQQRAAGLTHLFTARRLDGRTVGMGYLGTVCSRRFSASLSQATAAVSLAALIAAHEIAHVLGAPHDGERDSACATTPADYLMAPRINGSQDFSACSLEQMAPQAEAASCRMPIQAPGVWPTDGGSAPVQGGGGGGALPGEALLMLVLLWASRARSWRPVLTRSIQAAR